jgi:hypothetical protein
LYQSHRWAAKQATFAKYSEKGVPAPYRIKIMLHAWQGSVLAEINISGSKSAIGIDTEPGTEKSLL